MPFWSAFNMIYFCNNVDLLKGTIDNKDIFTISYEDGQTMEVHCCKNDIFNLFCTYPIYKKLSIESLFNVRIFFDYFVNRNEGFFGNLWFLLQKFLVLTAVYFVFQNKHWENKYWKYFLNTSESKRNQTKNKRKVDNLHSKKRREIHKFWYQKTRHQNIFQLGTLLKFWKCRLFVQDGRSLKTFIFLFR